MLIKTTRKRHFEKQNMLKHFQHHVGDGLYQADATRARPGDLGTSCTVCCSDFRTLQCARPNNLPVPFLALEPVVTRVHF